MASRLVIRLARLQPDKGDCLMWIDQIYIKQEDITKRSQQVQLIADIYTNVIRTVVWLSDYKNKDKLP